MALRCVIFLKRSYGSDQTRRLLALAVYFDGGYRVWLTGKALGQTVNLDAAQRQALADLVERGPILAVDGGALAPGGLGGLHSLGNGITVSPTRWR